MTENVETGGVMKFNYTKSNKNPKLDVKRKRELEEAYKKYGERKVKEKRNSIIKWLIAGIIIVVIIIFLLAR